MVNKVILIGNLGKDPEIRHLEGNVAVGRFPLATNESYKDRKGEWQTKTEWHDIVVWRSLAERAERDLGKGSLVYVEGKLTHRKWQDREGNDRYTTEVVANSFRIIHKRDSSSEGGEGYQSSGVVFPPAGDTDGDSDADSDIDDDLPF